MEFFFVYGIVFNFGNPLYAAAYGFNALPVWLVWTITAGIYAVLYALKAAGLYAMAKKAGMNKLVWCAFVPFASTYLMGELAGALRLGNAKIRHIGLYAMVAEFLLFAVQAMYYISFSYIFARGLFYVEMDETAGTVALYFTEAVSNGLQNLINVSNVLDYVFYILYTIAAIFLFVTFFRRYCPLSYIWMVILCVIIPIVTAMLVYAYRNRSPVDYEKIMAARAEQMRRMQQQYGQGGPYGGGPYNNGPYNNGGPYGGGPSSGAPGGASKTPDDPFGEFSGGDDPFGDFSEKKGDPGRSDGASSDGASSDGKDGDGDGFFS